MVHPIVDDFYSPNPAHARSAGFAQAKGQTITGPDKQVLRANTDDNSARGEGSLVSSPHTSGGLVGEAVHRSRIE
jgi:glutamine amidotransferase